jgi:hypothetical protein
MRRSRARLTRRVTALAALAAAVLAGGCATQEVAVAKEYLDEHTAATVTVGTRPWVFARARPEFAVNARDYLTLVPMDVNRAGNHVLYFYCYAWSTVDKRGAAETGGKFELVADGRQIPLTPSPTKPHDLGIGQPPLEPPSESASALVVPTSREVLLFLSRSHDVAAIRTRDGLGERFDVWDDGRDAIAEFLQGASAAR